MGLPQGQGQPRGGASQVCYQGGKWFFFQALLGKPAIATLGSLRKFGWIQNENKTKQYLNVEVIENKELQELKVKDYLNLGLRSKII